jgi:hypothetical protein
VQRRTQQASASAAAGAEKAAAGVAKASAIGAKWKQAASQAASKQASKLRKQASSKRTSFQGGGSSDGAAVVQVQVPPELATVVKAAEETPAEKEAQAN